MIFKPRNRNEKTYDAPKATARWFDAGPRETKQPCGFHLPEKRDDL